MSWAFAAILMGSVGLASYIFGGESHQVQTVRIAPAALPLPPAGDVESTASISQPGPEDIEVFRLEYPGHENGAPAADPRKLNALKDEMSSLNRRLETILDQNRTYAERIAMLEAELSDDGLRNQLAELDTTPTASGAAGNDYRPAPPQGIVTMRAPASTPSSPRADAAAQLPVPAVKPEMPAYRVVALGQPDQPIPLSQDYSDPVITGAVNATSTPGTTANDPELPVLGPSAPSGRMGNGGESIINRTDFGALIGEYADETAALKAWAHFKEQNTGRMQDLEPLFRPHEDDGEAGTLMAGPFANAADAAVACSYLIALPVSCQPVLYTGTPLVAARGF